MIANKAQFTQPTRIDSASRIEVFRGVNAIAPHLSAWSKLSQRASNQTNFFQSASWCMNWLKCNKDAEPVVITAWRGNELIMVLPMMLEQQFGIKSLETLSGADAEYSGPIFLDGIDQRAVFSATLEQLSKQGEYDLIRLNSVPEDLSICDLAKANRKLDSELRYSSIIEFSDFQTLDDYLASRSKSTRKSLRRKMQAFQKLGEVDCSVVPVTDDFKSTTFPKICEWKRQWFAANGVLGGNFNRADMEDQLAGLCQSDGATDPALATQLRLDGKLVACDVMLQNNSKLYSYVTARDLEFDKYGIGTVMDMFTIEHAITKGYHSMDLLAGPNQSKDSLSTKQIPLVDLRFALSEKGGWQASIDRLRIRDHIKTTFYKLPVGLRQSVLKLANRT